MAGDGNQIGTDAVALFKRVKRFVKADFGHIFDKAGALRQVLGQQLAQKALFDFDDAVGQAFGFVGTVNKIVGGAGKDDFRVGEVFEAGNMVGVQVGQEDLVDVVRGIAQACAAIGTPLLGGETAEHPGLMAPDEYDVAGAATGVVEADRMLGAEKVRAGDVLVALGASGLHSNGYSLVRRVIDHAGWGLEREVPEFGRTLGQELLEPTRLYTRVCLAMLETLSSPAAPGPVHALSHITGGGLAANVARVLPAGLIADVDRASWTVPPVFSTVRELGSVPWEDLEGTLNLGVWMVAVVEPGVVDAVLRVAEGSDIPAWVLGEVHEAAKYEAQGRVVSGTKGVDGGAVDIHGTYRTA